MTPDQLESLLSAVAQGAVSPVAALEQLKHFPGEQLEIATIDHQRHLRLGQPEVVFCEGKSAEQALEVCRHLAEATGTFLGTRASPELADRLKREHPGVEWNPTGRTVYLPPTPRPAPTGRGTILVVSAGTSDLAVAEEAAVVAEALGNPVERLVDVGVAGLHRLLSASERLREATVVIVVAGMEGALPSVVGGLVGIPVIAVPTSVGYGASLGGWAALLGMLNSCAAGVTVVNIDNGFGAAAAAHRINHLPEKEPEA
ncbi:MAG: nickel pincer cofactor biosynthesis protein LarB [Gemmatimonadales bacterium]|nr:nickel pincer cofactor biosynthesis protein LarB [Gemmatimonadales bacterium]